MIIIIYQKIRDKIIITIVFALLVGLSTVYIFGPGQNINENLIDLGPQLTHISKLNQKVVGQNSYDQIQKNNLNTQNICAAWSNEQFSKKKISVYTKGDTEQYKRPLFASSLSGNSWFTRLGQKKKANPVKESLTYLKPRDISTQSHRDWDHTWQSGRNNMRKEMGYSKKQMLPQS